MQKFWKEERGAALLLVLFIIIVFTMIGMAVVSASIGGAVRTETKQKDVQSVHLAEKALNEAVAIVKGKLATDETINLDQLQNDLQLAISDIQGNHIGTEYEKQYNEEPGILTTATLQNLSTATLDKYVIRIQVTATIKGVQRVLQQDIEVNSFPDILNYAAGSEDGDLIINGSPYFLGSDNNGGNLYAGKRLLIKNQAEYFYQSDTKKKAATRFPTLNGIAYVQSLNNIQYCDSSVTPSCDEYRSVKDASGDVEAIPASEILGKASETQVKNKKDFVGVDINDTFVDKLTEAIGGSKKERKDIAERFSNKTELMKYLIASGTLRVSPAKPTGSESSEEMGEYNNELIKFENYLNGKDPDRLGTLEDADGGSLLYQGDFHLNGEDFKQLKFSSKAKEHHEDDGNNGVDNSNWFIVFGDLDITNTKSTPIEVRANILVTGNVTIRGQVDMNSTLFTLGQTVIEDAAIRGLEERNKIDGQLERKELVLFSKGSILITRVNTNASTNVEEPFKRIPDAGFSNVSEDLKGSDIQVLDAFFYTDSTAELYGVGSIFWIRGGFFSKGDLTINALRGDAQVTSDESIVGEGDQIGQNKIDDKRARFIISYNNEIINENHQAAALPRVKTVQFIRGKRVMP